jgi:endoglucanase
MLANRAMTLVVVSRWKKSPELMEATSEIVDYIYGRNAVNTSFVTGSAWSSPMYPHHRIAGGDTVEAPLPGLLVGGVNASREDDIYHVSLGVRYPHEEAGKSYYDNQEAYASNETCINWNAALTFVLAALTESYGKD